jgi:hypothetical protein
VVAQKETEKCSKIYEVGLPSIRESRHCTIDLPVVTVRSNSNMSSLEQQIAVNDFWHMIIQRHSCSTAVLGLR